MSRKSEALDGLADGRTDRQTDGVQHVMRPHREGRIKIAAQKHKPSVTVGQLAAMDFSVRSTSRSTCRWGDLSAWLPSARYTRLARTIDIGRQAELATHRETRWRIGDERACRVIVCVSTCVVYGTVTI